MGFDPFTIALAGAAGQAGFSALGNASQNSAQNKANQRSQQFEDRRQSLIDELLAGVGGQGQFASLFQTDDAAFQKSIVDPAKHIFNSQIAPQIQQQAIAGGAQRGTGFQDDLTRAGVDLDQMINQQFMSFQQGGQDRIQNLISSILGSPGPQSQTAPPTAFNTLASGAAGFFQSPAFGNLAKDPNKQQAGVPEMGTPSQGVHPMDDLLNPRTARALRDQRPSFAIT